MITVTDVVFDTSAILLLALIAMPLLRKGTAALRHWVLAAALLCAALAPLAETVLPAWTPPMPITLEELPIAWSAPSAAGSIVRVSDAATPQPSVNTPPLGRNWSLTDLIVAIWMTGIAVSIGMLALGMVRLWQLTRRATSPTDVRWIHIVEQLQQTYGIRRRVDIRESSSPNHLLVWGWRRPTLIMSSSARAWDDDRLIAVLRHELAHVGRGDWLTQIAAETIRAIYWFNPLVWIVCARLHVECERACDDAVLDAGVEGSRYADHLLDIARQRRSRAGWMPAPAIVRASTLERRVKAMLDRTIDRRPLSRGARSVSLALLLVASMVVATIAAAQQFSSLTGTIVDTTNGLLPGVTLTLTNQETKAKYEIRSDRNGRYEFVGLPPGSYLLETRLPGFAVFRGAVTVSGPTIQQDMMLSVGTLEETITILGSDQVQELTLEERRALEERKAAWAREAEEYRARRAASAAKCPGGAGVSGPTIGGNIRTPSKLRDVKPQFPERLRGLEGDVILQAVIGTDGRVNTVDVVSTTYPEFAESTIEAVKQWVFDATLLNCMAIETAMKVTAHYRWK